MNAIGSGILAVLLVMVGVVIYGWRRFRGGEAMGEAEQRGKDREDAVRKAGESEDINALDEFWRGKR